MIIDKSGLKCTLEQKDFKSFSNSRENSSDFMGSYSGRKIPDTVEILEVNFPAQSLSLSLCKLPNRLKELRILGDIKELILPFKVPRGLRKLDISGCGKRLGIGRFNYDTDKVSIDKDYIKKWANLHEQLVIISPPWLENFTTSVDKKAKKIAEKDHGKILNLVSHSQNKKESTQISEPNFDPYFKPLAHPTPADPSDQTQVAISEGKEEIEILNLQPHLQPASVVLPDQTQDAFSDEIKEEIFTATPNREDPRASEERNVPIRVLKTPGKKMPREGFRNPRKPGEALSDFETSPIPSKNKEVLSQGEAIDDGGPQNKGSAVATPISHNESYREGRGSESAAIMIEEITFRDGDIGSNTSSGDNKASNRVKDAEVFVKIGCLPSPESLLSGLRRLVGGNQNQNRLVLVYTKT